jgi:hypothetical protein
LNRENERDTNKEKQLEVDNGLIERKKREIFLQPGDLKAEAAVEILVSEMSKGCKFLTPTAPPLGAPPAATRYIRSLI